MVLTIVFIAWRVSRQLTVIAYRREGKVVYVIPSNRSAFARSDLSIVVGDMIP